MMSDYIKNNEGKKILNTEKSEIKNNLDGIIVR